MNTVNILYIYLTHSLHQWEFWVLHLLVSTWHAQSFYVSKSDWQHLLMCLFAIGRPSFGEVRTQITHLLEKCVVCVLNFEFWDFFDISHIQILYQIYFLLISVFIPFGLSFEMLKFLTLQKSSLSIFHFMNSAFGVISKESLPKCKVIKLFPVFF